MAPEGAVLDAACHPKVCLGSRRRTCDPPAAGHEVADTRWVPCAVDISVGRGNDDIRNTGDGNVQGIYGESFTIRRSGLLVNYHLAIGQQNCLVGLCSNDDAVAVDYQSDYR